jgi:signal transduction histidine kinase
MCAAVRLRIVRLVARELRCTEGLTCRVEVVTDNSDDAAELAAANAVLQQCVDRLAHLSDVRRFVGEVLVSIVEVAGAVNGAVFRYEPASHALLMDACTLNGKLVDILKDERLAPWRRPFHIDEFLPDWRGIVSASGQSLGYSISYDDPRVPPAVAAWHHANGCASGVRSVLRRGDTIIGLISLAYREEVRIAVERVRVVRTLEQYATLALEVTRLAEESRQAAVARAQAKGAEERVAELAAANAALSRSIDALSSSDDLVSFAGQVAQEAIRACGAVLGSVALFDEATQTLRFVTIVGRGSVVELVEDRWTTPGTPFSASLMAAWRHVRETRDVFWIDWADLGTYPEELRNDFLVLKPFFQTQGHRFAAAVPLVLRGTVIGFLGLAFDLSMVERPAARLVEICRVYAQQLTLAVQGFRITAETERAAVAIERERAARNRAAELGKANDALARSVAHLGADPGLDGFLTSVLREAIAASGATSGTVFLLDRSGWRLRQVALVLRGEVVDTQHDERTRYARAGLPTASNRPWQAICANREVYWIDHDLAPEGDCPVSMDGIDHGGHRFVAALPMVEGERPIGFLELAYDAGLTERPSDSRLDLSRVLAQHAALAVRLSRLADQARQAAIAREQEQAAEDRAAALARVNAALRASSEQLVAIDNLDRYLDELMRAVARVAGASTGCVVILDPGGESVRLMAVVNQAESPTSYVTASLPDVNVPLVGRARMVWEAMTGATDHWRGTARDAAFTDRNAAYWNSLGYEFVIGIPVLLHDTVLGILSLGFRNSELPVTDAQVELVGVFGQQAALAIGMTRLAESAKLAAVAEERNRLARDLHDTLAQALALIVMQLADAQDKLGPAWDTARQPLETVRELAVASLAEARRSVGVLRPATATALGLPRAVHEAADLVRRYFGGRLHVHVTGTPQFMDAAVEVELLGIVREALTNAAKHSRATQVDIELAFLDNRALRVVVADNGQGFNPDHQRTDSYGLVGMRERAARIGAALTLVTEPGAGTEIVAVWPA